MKNLNRAMIVVAIILVVIVSVGTAVAYLSPIENMKDPREGIMPAIEEKEEYKITFVLNDEYAWKSFPKNQIKQHGVPIQLSEIVPEGRFSGSPGNVIFLYWSTDPSGIDTAPAFASGDVFDVDCDLTLYPIYLQY